jgi:hypothetical protein
MMGDMDASERFKCWEHFRITPVTVDSKDRVRRQYFDSCGKPDDDFTAVKGSCCLNCLTIRHGVSLGSTRIWW